jgi:hypothetical protein
VDDHCADADEGRGGKFAFDAAGQASFHVAADATSSFCHGTSESSQ